MPKNIGKIVFGFMSIICFSLPALALEIGEARQLALAGDVERLEAKFSQHQEEFDGGLIGVEAFKEPYKAFETTHPTVNQTTQLWLDTYPASASALASLGLLAFCVICRI